MKRKIIIVGYPKSGTTWLTRLAAELVNCPVRGFLYSDHKEIAIEGLDRKSEYECYKSHHQIHEIEKEDLELAKIIYVVRDPRDVSISGQYHFNKIGIMPLSKNSNSILRLLNKFKKLVNDTYRKSIGLRVMRKKMINAVLSGDNNITPWYSIPWKDHVIPYFENDSILKIKYESVINDSFYESHRILKFLGLERTTASINEAIKKQSFKYIKANFREKNKFKFSPFLRKGESGQWKKDFSKKENRIFTSELHRELALLGYDLE